MLEHTARQKYAHNFKITIFNKIKYMFRAFKTVKCKQKPVVCIYSLNEGRTDEEMKHCKKIII